MSEENVEKVRSGFAAYNRGDIDDLLERFHPDVVIQTLLLGTHTGREALHRLYEENRQNLSGFRLEPEELIDAGEAVIAVARMGGEGAMSRIELGDRIAFLMTFKDGLIVHQQAFRNKEKALEAAGLSE